MIYHQSNSVVSLRRQSPDRVSDLLRSIEKGETCPGSLSRPERLRCVEQLAVEGRRDSEIARILKVHRATVHRDRRRLRGDMAQVLERLDSRQIAAFVVARAEHIYSAATGSGNLVLAWKVVRELPMLLDQLGVIQNCMHEDRSVGMEDRLKRLRAGKQSDSMQD